MNRTIIARGQAWGCEFDFLPACKGRREAGVPMEPDTEAQIDLVSVCVPASDVELLEYLDPLVLDEIESEIADYLAELDE